MERRRHGPPTGPVTPASRHGQAQPLLVPPVKHELPPPPPKAMRVAEPIAPPGSSGIRAEAAREAAERAAQGEQRRKLAPQTASPRRARRPHQEPQVDPQSICRVVYADDALVVADKAAGYPVTPGGAFQHRSVLKALQAQGYAPLYPISLLDSEASGLVVLSRSASAAKALRWNWRSGLCERDYIGVVQGDMPGARGKISLPIGAVRHGRGLRHQVLSVPEGGRTALTEWKLLARSRGLSRLQLTVKAGRCHQLRIHLAAMGFAIVGDRQYRPATTEVPIEALVDLPRKHIDNPGLPPGQIALHCARIRMPHPTSGKAMDWSAPVPRALVALMPGAWVLEG